MISSRFLVVTVPAALMQLAVSFTPAAAEMGPNICQDEARNNPRFRVLPADTVWNYKPQAVASTDVIPVSSRRLYAVGTTVYEVRAGGEAVKWSSHIRNLQDCHEFHITAADYEKARLAGQFNFSLDINYNDPASDTRTCLPVPVVGRSADKHPDGHVVVRVKLGEGPQNRTDRQAVIAEADKGPKAGQVWCYSAEIKGLPALTQ